MTGADLHAEQERRGQLVGELASRIARDGHDAVLEDLVAKFGVDEVMWAIDVLERDALGGVE